MLSYEHGGDIYGNPGVVLDFSVNTNPMGMPQDVASALTSRVDEFTRYPDPMCRELCASIAQFEDVPGDWVLCGNGAADLIYRLCFAVKPRNALVCAPTFSEYERALEQLDCHVTHHFLTPDNDFVLTEAFLDKLVSGVDIVFLCNPNNPTGRLITRSLMELIINRARLFGTLVVVDECFLDFTLGESCKLFLSDMLQLVVLRAFTKLYAMAGLRLGYLLTSNIDLKRIIEETGQCWSVSVPAQIAGISALSCEGWVAKTLCLVEEESSFLSDELGALGIEVYPSDANFLLLRTDKPFYEPLLERGILIRKCENFIGLDASFYRIGIKTRADNARLVEAVGQVVVGY